MKQVFYSVAIAALAAVALTSCAAPTTHHSNLAQRAEPTNGSTTPTSGSTEARTNEPSPLSVEKYSDPTALVQAYFVEQNEWMNSGATEKNHLAWLNAPNSDAYMPQITKPLDNAYEAALIDMTKATPDNGLGKYIQRQEDFHAGVLNNAFITIPDEYNTDANDTEAYHIDLNPDTSNLVIVNQTKDEIVVKLSATYTDNADKSDIASHGGKVIDTNPRTGTMTWDNIGGVWKLTEVKTP